MIFLPDSNSYKLSITTHDFLLFFIDLKKKEHYGQQGVQVIEEKLIH